jgi:hypothetical protein
VQRGPIRSSKPVHMKQRADAIRRSRRLPRSDDRILFIPLDSGHTVVDRCDEDLAAFTWSKNQQGYALNWMGRLFLHRVILERKIGRSLADHEYVDHINGVRLDNRRSNLRVANRFQTKRTEARTGTTGQDTNASLERSRVRIRA